MRTGFRFRPPAIELSVEHAWALMRAFGPRESAAPRPGEPTAAVEAAARLGLAERIGSRTPPALMRAELGEDGAARLSGSYRLAAAAALGRRGVCRAIAVAAEKAGLPVIFLKGAALELAGIAAAGSRTAGDIDVLTLGDRSEDLQRACCAAGFRQVEIRPAEHELPPLVYGGAFLVEVHRHLRGVRLDGKRPATGDQMMERGLCRAAGQGLEAGWLPAAGVLAAHALVHGVAQHGAAPDTYPPLRVVCDLADLAFGDREWHDFVENGWPWIARDVSREEAEAVWQLASRLAAGDDPRALAGESGGAGCMLRHALAGVLDPGYARSLRIMHLTQPVAGTSRARTLLRKVAANLWLSRGEVDLVYGPQPSAARYLAMRLWRPWDLALQAMASLRARRRGSGGART